MCFFLYPENSGEARTPVYKGVMKPKIVDELAKVEIFSVGDVGYFCQRLAIFLAIYGESLAIFRNFILATLAQSKK